MKENMKKEEKKEKEITFEQFDQLSLPERINILFKKVYGKSK